MNNDDKIIILELEELDVYNILTLLQREASQEKNWNGYWSDIVNQIRESIKTQKSGQFFQCSACLE